MKQFILNLPATEGMPHDPAELIDDLVRMGLYQPQTLELAKILTEVEIKEALLLRISHSEIARQCHESSQ
jgi:hypothetical protein